MNLDLFKKSLKTTAIFLSAAIILFFAIVSGRPKKYIMMELDGIILLLSFFFLFTSIIFYFLFKYQEEEYHKKSMFWKLPLLAALGALVMVIFAIYFAFNCSGEECMGVPILIFSIPISAISLAIIALILTINAWYRTNLYIVAWTIFAFILIPGVFLIILKQGLEEPAIIMPFGFLVGTIIAIVSKKLSDKNKVASNQ